MTGTKLDASTSARHRTDAVSLIFGLIFLGVAGWWAASYYLDWMITLRLPDVGWLVAGALILLGLIGIAGSLRREPRDAAALPGVTEPGGESGPGSTPVPTDPEPEPVRPDEPTAELDRPAASDPGGHRPE
jgi:hypothetical protein